MSLYENTVEAPCRIYLGTSGYSFTEWIQAGFYPRGTAGKDMLSLYASQFNAIELNYTWYQTPKAEAEAMERMLLRVPPDFVFTAKLARTMTHEIDPKNWRFQVGLYRKGMAPLIQAGRLSAILVQLSSTFDRTRENRIHLARLLGPMKT